MDNRLINIETKISYQDDTIEQLNQVIIEQQKDIDILKSNYKILKEKLDEIAEEKTPDRPQRKPPHY